jgi:cobalamin biosynthesis protein CobD/CbiB
MTTTRLSVALFLLGAFLLLSMGGAVVAAPLSLPLMYWAARRHPSRSFRWAAGIIGGLTTVELAWAVVYFVGGEERPTIWLLPLAAGLVYLAACVTARRSPVATRTKP